MLAKGAIGWIPISVSMVYLSYWGTIMTAAYMPKNPFKPRQMAAIFLTLYPQISPCYNELRGKVLSWSKSIRYDNNACNRTSSNVATLTNTATVWFDFNAKYLFRIRSHVSMHTLSHLFPFSYMYHNHCFHIEIMYDEMRNKFLAYAYTDLCTNTSIESIYVRIIQIAGWAFRNWLSPLNYWIPHKPVWSYIVTVFQAKGSTIHVAFVQWARKSPSIL